MSALCIDANGVRTLDFEKKFHTEISVKKNGGIPPHLDVGITLDSNHVVAIESKFTEPLSRATVNKSKFKPSYFPPSGGLWAKQGLHDCRKFAQELKRRAPHVQATRCVAAPQARPRAGGRSEFGKTEFSPYYNEFRLYYLYYDWPGEQSEAHKKAIKRFADRRSYGSKHLYRLARHHPMRSGLPGYLGKRYFCGKGAPK